MADQIMGFIPKNKYVEITYWMLLVSTGGGLLLTLLALAGFPVGLGNLLSVIGFLGLLMAVLGIFVFKEEFSALDQAHLKYLGVLFIIFFVLGLFLGAALAIVMFLMLIVMLSVSAIQFLLFFTGYNSWKHGRTITKDNLKSEIKLALSRS